jgi:decaprenylphospho-beta-D-erythro-pentofuranosid-2-ulose 2-reductase
MILNDAVNHASGSASVSEVTADEGAGAGGSEGVAFSSRRAVIVGATSGVGRALARRMAQAGYDLVIAGRDQVELDIMVSDIVFRHGHRCQALRADIADPEWSAEAFVDTCCLCLGGRVDSLFIPAGGAREDDSGPNPAVVAPLTAVNFVGPARLGAAFARVMQAAGGGAIVFFSSIAAAAPRSENSAYSAAKAALEVYATGLRHALEGQGVRIISVTLGYADTPQSYGLQLSLPVTAPEVLAERLLKLSLGRGGSYHLPRFWWLVTTTLRMLPWPVYRRLFR